MKNPVDYQEECKKKFDAFVGVCAKDMQEGYAFIALSEASGTGNVGYVITKFGQNALLKDQVADVDVSKLLDIRVVNKDREYRLFRNNIGSSFYENKIVDLHNYSEKNHEKPDYHENEYYDDIYYLDMDEKESRELEGDMVKATGGGRYILPMDHKKNAGVRIRYYLTRNEESGVAGIKAWRIVGLEEG